MVLAEGSTFAGYTIVRQLGSGGMSEVYLAWHPRLPRQDALKILRPDVSADGEYRARFNREADSTIWSLNEGDVPSPTVTPDPTEAPLPVEQESPMRVCMQQTGQTRRECREDILRSNGLP